MARETARLFIKTLDRRKFFGMPQLRATDRTLHHIDGAIVDLQRHRIGMSIFATMRDRESGRVTEPIRRSMNYLSDHRQGTNGARADAGHEKELREISWSAVSGSCQIAVQTTSDHVLAPKIVM